MPLAHAFVFCWVRLTLALSALASALLFCFGPPDPEMILAASALAALFAAPSAYLLFPDFAGSRFRIRPSDPECFLAHVTRELHSLGFYPRSQSASRLLFAKKSFLGPWGSGLLIERSGDEFSFAGPRRALSRLLVRLRAQNQI
jgi:hypothetical protein